MRVDKFLKNSRLIKRRTVAKEACDGGRIKVNGKTAKAGSDVNVGDVLSISFGEGGMTVEVVSVSDSVRKEDADGMYRIIEQ